MARFVGNSQNAKIAGKYKVAATYAPIKQSCPSTCELKDSGCYAQSSYVGMINREEEARHDGDTPLQVAKSEALAIDLGFPKGVPQDGGRGGGRPLRIHVSGDCTTKGGARVVSAAARRYTQRGGGPVWSYTHAWRKVPRSAWEGVSTLASVKSISEVMEARKQGYAPAIVVPEHKDERLYKLGPFKFIPCPAQTRDLACTDCRLCFDADALLSRKQGIAFAAHGTKTSEIKRRLKVL